MATESFPPPLQAQKVDNPPDPKAQVGEGEVTAVIKRCLEFWFEDGNVILQAEQIQFRVHISVLSLHSNIFRDMANIAQKHQEDSADAVDHVNGCPLVHLWDKAVEIQHIISNIYHGVKVHNWTEPMTLSDISILLRLGKKYEIDHLVAEGLRRLRADHPTTLAGWEKITSVEIYQAMDMEGQFGDYADIINLAHEQSVHSILPAAYLRCVLAGFDLKSFLPTTSILDLCTEARENCMVGRESIIRAANGNFRLWRKRSGDLSPANGCTTLRPCMDKQAKAVEEFPLWKHDILTGALLAPLKQTELAGFCPKCAKAVRAKYNECREDLWKKLPEMFNLSGWEGLKDFAM
ncbi:hypothetical protein GALMADRAFT_245645 [Galerina marginata CBS 339.88]|uniref:BTB domain-containing protein n=1 Tax=Galerina marginata (strain CBS 339.88) TaxID=685588 RepID=A0A067T2Z1_GALM3|nr:hypothetical protein GALMADRAFT_245645 [Galerina marginata CBS 339.88]